MYDMSDRRIFLCLWQIYQDKSEKVICCNICKNVWCLQGNFEMPVGDQDKVWALHFTCDLCKRILKGKIESFASLHSGILKCKSFGILFNLNIFFIIQWFWKIYIHYVATIVLNCHSIMVAFYIEPQARDINIRSLTDVQYSRFRIFAILIVVQGQSIYISTARFVDIKKIISRTFQ